jgi:methyl-accepting chemotaxis protein
MFRRLSPFRRFSLVGQLFAAFGLVAVLLAGTAAYAVYALARTDADAKRADEFVRLADKAQALDLRLTQLRNSLNIWLQGASDDQAAEADRRELAAALDEASEHYLLGRVRAMRFCGTRSDGDIEGANRAFADALAALARAQAMANPPAEIAAYVRSVESYRGEYARYRAGLARFWEIRATFRAEGNRMSELTTVLRDGSMAAKDAADAQADVNLAAREWIAAAVEEQSASTAEIARNVQQASAGTAEVSSNIVTVTQAARDTGKSANDMLGSAGDLGRESARLSEQVDRFLREVRAA